MENTNWNDVFAGARTYIPLMKKAEIVSHCAERCIDRVVVNTGEKFRGDTPPMYRENGQRKRRYLMGILAKAYLRLSFDAAEDDEWLMSAEYILAGGNPNVILCERGIRTFEKMIRNNLDISAIPLMLTPPIPTICTFLYFFNLRAKISNCR